MIKRRTATTAIELLEVPIMEEAVLTKQELIFDAIRTERYRQDQIWGEQDHSIFYWIGILTEEVGEAAKAAIEFNIPQMKKELIEVAAVVVAFLECLDRNSNAVYPSGSHYCPDQKKEEQCLTTCETNCQVTSEVP